MKYPVLSFLIALLIFAIGVVIILVSPSFHQNILIPATVEIDAFMINDMSDKKVEKTVLKAPKKKEKEEPKFADAPDNGQQEVKKESDAKESKIMQNAQNSDPDSQKKALILHGPLPKIPDHLRDEAFKSHAMARFYINPDGSSRVELVTPCASPELNYLLLKNLSKWKFSISDTTSIQDIRVNFMVE